MKFRDGLWQLRQGVKVDYAVHAYDIDVADDAFVVTAPTRYIANRGDTLNASTLSIEYSAPMADVIKVSIEHFAGVADRGPEFTVATSDDDKVEIVDNEGEVTLRSGRLSVAVERGAAWHATFAADGRVLTESGFRSLGYVTTDDGNNFLHEQLSLGLGTCVYGLGERFGPLVKNGQVIELLNADGGTSSEQAYKNVPFYLTNDGYGVFIAEAAPVSLEVASEHVSCVQFSIKAERLTYYVIYGPTPKEVIERYTALTGRPALPPPWSFGLWLSTSFTTSYDEATVTYFIEEMARRKLPLRVFHFDCFWMREFNWCDFEWDPRTFPDPQGLLKRLKSYGLEISVWINPYIAQRSPMFAEGAARGHLVRRANGDVWQVDQWQPGMGVVDFTSESARDWYVEKLQHLLTLGVSCFKTDFGERIPTDVVWADGSDPEKMHNYYSLLYNQTVFKALEESRGSGEAVVFARSSTTGGQCYPVHWGGDSTSTFPSMAETLRGGLSLGLCGFGFWSHDIGGFEGTPDVAVFKRWIAFGLLSSHSRLHASESYRVPWDFDEEACDVLRFFTELKMELMPYLWSAACEANDTGIPMMRAMVLEFPEDPACAYLDRQYMLGSDILVAPVLSPDGSVQYYLPDGKWTHLLTGEELVGGTWRTEVHDFLSLPVLVRAGALLPLGSQRDRPDYDWQEQLRVRLYQLEDGGVARCSVPALEGQNEVEFTATRREGELLLETTGAIGDFSVELPGLAVQGVRGGTLEGANIVRATGPGQVVVTL